MHSRFTYNGSTAPNYASGVSSTFASAPGSSTSRWPRYQYGDLYTYEIRAGVNEVQQRVVFGSFVTEPAPTRDCDHSLDRDHSLAFKSLTLDREVRAEDPAKGTELRAINLTEGFSVRLSNGGLIQPYMMAIEYDSDDNNIGQEGLISATAQFFNKPPRTGSSEMTTTGQPLANCILVQDRIIVQRTVNHDMLQFYAMRDSATGRTLFGSAPNRPHTVCAMDWQTNKSEYLRDQGTEFLNLWSTAGFFRSASPEETLLMPTKVQHLVKYHAEKFLAGAAAPSASVTPHLQV